MLIDVELRARGKSTPPQVTPGGIRRARRSADARSPSGPYRPLARRAADRFRPGHPVRPLPDAGRGVPGPVRPRRLLLRRRRRRMRSASTTTCRSCGSCRRRRCCRTAAPSAACRSPASSTRPPTAWTASSGCGTRMSGWPRKGGGIGSYWGNLRSIGEKVGAVGKTSGVIPFIRVMDQPDAGDLARARCGAARRRSTCRSGIPEIEEFVEIRRPTGGDPNRKALNLHHGILVSDAFMRAVEADEPWPLLSPKDETRGAVDLGARAVDPHPDRADRDRRAVPDLLRPREPRAAGASQAGRAGGEDLQPVLRDHAADRARPARHGAHRGVLPVAR